MSSLPEKNPSSIARIFERAQRLVDTHSGDDRLTLSRAQDIAQQQDDLSLKPLSPHEAFLEAFSFGKGPDGRARTIPLRNDLG